MAEQGPKKELSQEMRLLLAFLLMGVVMFVSQMWLKPPVSPDSATKKAAVTQPATATTKSGEPAPAAPAEATAAAAAPNPAATPAVAQPNFVIDNQYFHIVFSNQGGNVRSWQLKGHKGSDGKPLDMVNPAAGLQYPFSLYFPGQKPAADVNWSWYTQTGDPDGLGVTYEFSDGHTTVRKTFRFEKSSYLARVNTSVVNDGKPVSHMIEWRGGFGDHTVANSASTQRTLYFDLAENKLTEHTVSSAKSGPLTNSGSYSFTGVSDQYFAAVFLPQGDSSMQMVTFPDWLKTPIVEKPEGFPGFAVSMNGGNRFDVFVGPKDLDLLTRINPKLTQVVDFGWLWFLAKPLFAAVNWVNDQFVHNFGWSIVLVTIAINFLLFPLKISSMKSMKKMQSLKPQLDAINAKYRNLKITDPRKAEQNQEVMELYKVHGVSPMGGCMPMALQIPFFFAFYKVFTVSAEMRGASWLWVADLSQPETLPIKILPLAMIASQFFMQKMTPQPNQDPAQARMMMFMPLIFGFMFYNFASGLVLYYLTSNLVSMAQQYFFNRTVTADVTVLPAETPKKKNGRK